MPIDIDSEILSITMNIKRSCEFLNSEEGFSMNPVSSYALTSKGNVSTEKQNEKANPFPLPSPPFVEDANGTDNDKDNNKKKTAENGNDFDYTNIDLLEAVASEEDERQLKSLRRGYAVVNGDAYHEPGTFYPDPEQNLDDGYHKVITRKSILATAANATKATEKNDSERRPSTASYTIDEARANCISKNQSSRPSSASNNFGANLVRSNKKKTSFAETPLSYPTRSSNRNSNTTAVNISKKTQVKLEELREAMRAKELEECSFTPNISEKSRIIASKTSESAIIKDGKSVKIPISDAIKTAQRLFDDGKKNKACLEHAQTISNRSGFTECSCTPAINTTSRGLAMRKRNPPLQDRAMTILKEKELKLKQVREELDKEQSLTFQPKVSRISEIIVANAMNSNISEGSTLLYRKGTIRPEIALIQSAAMNEKKLDDIRKKAEEQEKKECTFKPKIDEGSKKILARYNNGSLPTFDDRQSQYEAKKKNDAKRIKDEITREITFKPKIDETSIHLVQQHRSFSSRSQSRQYLNGSESDNDNDESIHEKLYKTGVEKIRASNSRASSSLEAKECTFRPVINDLSSYIARPSSIEELTKDQRTKQNRLTIEREMEERFKKAYTFEPKISDLAKVTKSHYSGSETDIMTRIKEHKMIQEHTLQQKRKIEEYTEMQGCSFKPTINSGVPLTTYEGPSLCLSQSTIGSRAHSNNDGSLRRSSSTTEIKGIARFMELQQKARQLQQEQKMHEQKVFGLAAGGKLNKSSMEGRPYTVPQPFNLSSSKISSNTTNSLLAATATDAILEKSFRPQTNAAAMRQLVSNILKSD